MMGFLVMARLPGRKRLLKGASNREVARDPLFDPGAVGKKRRTC